MLERRPEVVSGLLVFRAAVHEVGELRRGDIERLHLGGYELACVVGLSSQVEVLAHLMQKELHPLDVRLRLGTRVVAAHEALRSKIRSTQPNGGLSLGSTRSLSN